MVSQVDRNSTFDAISTSPSKIKSSTVNSVYAIRERLPDVVRKVNLNTMLEANKFNTNKSSINY